jgi:flagellar hook-associated protein 3 FlgL
MRVSDVSNAYTMINCLSGLKSTQNQLSEELTSGKSVENLEDDSSLANSLLNSQVNREKLIQQNTNISLCDNIASAGVDSLGYIDKELDLATSVSEAAQTAASSASTSSSTSDYTTQIDSIIGEVLSMGNTKYGDDYIFAGDASGSSTAPYSYTSPMSDELSSAISTAKAATSSGTTYDTDTATAAASIQTQIDSALAEVNATDSSGNTTYGGTFSYDSTTSSYVFSGTATDATKAICTALDDMTALQSTVSSGGSVGTTISALSTASTTVSSYGKYVYSGSGDGRQIKVSDGVELSPFAGSTGNDAILTSLNNLVALRNAIAGGDTDTIATATENISVAQDAVVDASSDLSTTQSRLSLLSERNSSTYTNLDDAEETSTNASEEETTVKLLAAQQAYSAALQGTSLLLSKSLLDYL